jgi:hypothetical protein
VRLFGDTDVDVILPRPTRRREKRQSYTQGTLMSGRMKKKAL